MGYNEDYRDFLDGLLTPMLKEKYHIKSIEKTNVCFRAKGILAPYFEVYVRAILDNNQKEDIKELIITAYKKYYKTDILPGINILTSALFVCQYKGKYYHLCVAHDSADRNFVDYEIFELLPEGYEAVLNMKYAMYQSEYDKKLVIRINHMDRSIEDAYAEAYRNGMTEKLLEMVLWRCEMNYYDGLSEKEMCYIKEIREIGATKGNCKELSNLCRQAHSDYTSGVISETAYSKIYAVCMDYAYPR